MCLAVSGKPDTDHRRMTFILFLGNTSPSYLQPAVIAAITLLGAPACVIRARRASQPLPQRLFIGATIFMLHIFYTDRGRKQRLSL